MTESIVAIEDRASAEAFLETRIGQGVKPGLERITGLLAFMGDPQRDYPIIHIAGTNGKTTVTRMVQDILGGHGLATGGFTSPHLDRIEERFAIHGVHVDEHDFTDAVRDIAWFVTAYEERSGESVTYFEVTAALALSIFSTAAIDVAVVEVGLGGRLDATNVVDAAVSVVTGIDVDHVEFLGSSLAGIAAEKAAIVKAGGTLVTGPLPDDAITAVEARVAETAANWIRAGRDFDVVDASIAVGGWMATIDGVYDTYSDLYLPLHGRHQVTNLATAIATAEMFLGRALDAELLTIAVAAMSAPGRLEVVAHRPLVVVDGSHNEQGIAALAVTLEDEFPAMRWHLVIGVRGERDVATMVAPLDGIVAKVHAVAAEDAASIPPAQVAAEVGTSLGVASRAHGTVAEGVAAAIDEAGEAGGVIVAGSLYVAGEARRTFPNLLAADGLTHVRFEAPVADDEDAEDGVRYDEEAD